jgi:hypothetical protein
LPRDIIIIGNAISELIYETKNKGITVDPKEIRSTISQCSKSFGEELFRICAAQINTDEMPTSAGKYGFSDFYTSSKEYSEDTTDILKKIVHGLDSEILDEDGIARFKELIHACSNGRLSGARLLNILWQNGALGYSEYDINNELLEVFVVDCGYADLIFPKDKTEYLLRLCLFEIAGRGKNYKYGNRVVMGGNE